MIERKNGAGGKATRENGFVLVLALMVLVILSLLGSLSLRIANTEVITAGSVEGSLASFYLLEAVALTGATFLEQQNTVGDDCIEARPERCLVKELHLVENSSLEWLDEAFSGDTDKPVFDLTVLDPTVADDDSAVPRRRKFPDNWVGSNQRSSRLPESLRSSGSGLEPAGYVDMEEGGDDLIRFAVQDHGRIGAYSIGADDPVIRQYRIYGLYYVGADGSAGYPGKFGVEMGYRMELKPMEIM